MVLGALLGITNAFDMPARQAFAVEMVGRDDVANAVGLNSALFNASRILGPAVGGPADRRVRHLRRIPDQRHQLHRA